jgi:hypothetical protein
MNLRENVMMKKVALLAVAVLAVAETGSSQTINWRSLREDQHNVIQLNAGYDLGANAGVGYNRSVTLMIPAVLTLDVTIPMGEVLVDDFRMRLGVQAEIVQFGGFSSTVSILGTFRRYENDLVRIASFGSDFAVVAGYYEPSWSVAGEFGFAKSITSHLRHSDVMKTAYPAIRDGWYVPTGGHYYYGLQGAKTVDDEYDISLRLGTTRAQASDEGAVFAHYVQLGLGVRF